MKKIFYLLLGITFLASCDEKKGQTISIKSEIDIKMKSIIKIDTVHLERPVFSGVGRLDMLNNQVVYIDQVFQTITYYDTALNVKATYIGRGEGPNEVDNVHFVCDLEHTEYLIIDNFGYHTYLNDSTKKLFQIFDWNDNTPTEILLKNPDGEKRGIYTIDWSPNTNSNFSATIDNNLYVPIITEHPDMNAFQDESFYEKTYAVGRFNLENGKLEKIGVKWSENYDLFPFIPNLVGVDITSTNNELLVAQRVDSLIEVYDRDLKLLRKFGVGGKEFTLDYRQTKTIDEALDNWDVDLSNQSFYSNITSINNVVFRVYYPKGKNENARMQIYFDEVLSYDVAVPNRFRVIGKVGNYYYADGVVDEENEVLKVYRFTLNE